MAIGYEERFGVLLDAAAGTESDGEDDGKVDGEDDDRRENHDEPRSPGRRGFSGSVQTYTESSPSATEITHTGSTTNRWFSSGSKGSVDMTSSVRMYTARAQNRVVATSRRAVEPASRALAFRLNAATNLTRVPGPVNERQAALSKSALLAAPRGVA